MNQFLPPGTDVPALLEELAESFLLASHVDPARPDAASEAARVARAVPPGRPAGAAAGNGTTT